MFVTSGADKITSSRTGPFAAGLWSEGTPMSSWRGTQAAPRGGGGRAVAAPGCPRGRASQRRHLSSPAALAGLATAATAAWVGLGIGGPQAARWVDDLATVLAALLAAVACARAASRHGEETRRFWCWLALAGSAWATAQIIWAVQELMLGDAAPFPSWADLGYLVALPLAAVALLSHPVLRDRGRASVRALLDGLTVAATLVFCSWTFVLGPVWRDSDLTTLGRVVALAYPCGDVVVVFLALCVLQGIEGVSRFSLRWVLAGMTAMALTDSGFTYLAVVRSYETGHLIDVGWVAAYLAVAVGASSPAPGAEGLGVGQAFDAPPLTLFVPMFVALSVVAVQTSLGQRLDAVAWGLALVLVLSVLARLGPLAADPRRPACGTGDTPPAVQP